MHYTKILFKDKFQRKPDQKEGHPDRGNLHNSKPTRSLQGGKHLILNN